MTYKRCIISDILASFFILYWGLICFLCFLLCSTITVFWNSRLCLTLLIDSVFTELVIFCAVFFSHFKLCFLVLTNCYIKLLVGQFLEFYFFDISYRYFILIFLPPPVCFPLSFSLSFFCGIWFSVLWRSRHIFLEYTD